MQHLRKKAKIETFLIGAIKIESNVDTVKELMEIYQKSFSVLNSCVMDSPLMFSDEKLCNPYSHYLPNLFLEHSDQFVFKLTIVDLLVC